MKPATNTFRYLILFCSKNIVNKNIFAKHLLYNYYKDYIIYLTYLIYYINEINRTISYALLRKLSSSF